MKRQRSTASTASTASAAGGVGGVADRPSRFYRFLLSFMGPPQLGSLDAPLRPVPPRVDICRSCGQPRDAHELERLAEHTASRCPVGPARPGRAASHGSAHGSADGSAHGSATASRNDRTSAAATAEPPPGPALKP